MLPPALGLDVRRVVDSWGERAPERPFLLWAPFEDDPRTWTRRDFAGDVARLAGGLVARGFLPGDRLALVLPNCPELLLTWTAVTSLGGVAVCLDPRASAEELGYALDHSGAVVVVTHAERADDVVSVAGSRLVLLDRGPESVAALARESDPRTSAGPVPWDAPAGIQYTSGTTARPKAVVWSQAACLWAGQVGAAHQRLGPRDVNLVHLPLFHTNALSYSFLSSLWSGGTLVLQPRFSASRFWSAAVEHRATWTSVVSFCLRALEGREVPGEHAFRGWASSAAVAPSAVTGGVPVTGWFGMTETVSHPVVSDLTRGVVPGSMGRAAPEYAVRLVDDDGAELPPGATGELQVLGRPGVSLFSEYLHDHAATRAAFTADGWFRTGDRVRVDEAGDWWFVERDKDVLKVGGENVGAPEIERVLLAADGVREVAVVGRPDAMLGEVPVAFVLAGPGASVSVADLASRCERALTAYKRPREIRVVDALPRSTLDKVAKAELRRRLLDEVALDA